MSNSNIAWQKHDVPGVWVGEARGFNPNTDPTVAILGGVHGDEQTGREVVNQSLESLNLDAGRVFVGHGNLEAMQQTGDKGEKGRRYTEGGVNLNRSFRELSEEEVAKDPQELPYEVRRGQELSKILRQSDALLDLHDFTDPNGPIFLIANKADEAQGLKAARAIGAPVISTGWSEAEPGGSDYFMDTLGCIGLCYELGDKTKPEVNLKRGHGAVRRFLIARGMFEGKLPPLFTENGQEPRFIWNERAFKLKTGGTYELLLPEGFRTFGALEEGQEIAHLNGKIFTAEKDQVIIFPSKPENVKVGDEAFTLGASLSRRHSQGGAL